MDEQQAVVDERFYQAAFGSDESDTACADCGEPVVSQKDDRRALCTRCFDGRVTALRTAAERGFKIGL